MSRAPLSLRRQLLLGILVPVVAFVALGAASLYRAALVAADTAYDRTLLASAKVIGEQLRLQDDGAAPHVVSDLPYAALEAFEADSRSRLFYRILGFRGELVSGYADMPPPRPETAGTSPYAALVHFYDDDYQGTPVRMAVLLQPVAGPAGQGMATIQVAETFELRHTLAHGLLRETLLRQAALIAVIAVVVVWVVQRATRPVRALSEHLAARAADDLSPLPTDQAPRELLPVIDATNGVMARLAHLLEHQKRFVRDASHQLRTPLAVLKTQVQSALRGDIAPMQALREIHATADRATRLANQMLALAKVEQVQARGAFSTVALADVVSTAALDLAPLIAAKALDFELRTTAVPVHGHDWMLRELVSNLLANAVRETPAQGRLLVAVAHEGGQAVLRISDTGGGLPGGMATQLFEPFHTRHPTEGSGLGLTICHNICTALGARLVLSNRLADGAVAGLDAEVRFPAPTPVHA